MKKRNLRSLKRRKEKKRWRSLYLVVAVSLAVCLGIFFAARQFLSVGEILFIGNRHLKNEELRSLTGVKKHDSLFGVSGKEIHQRLKKSPWIKEAIVRKELPGTIVIQVTEAVPVAILNLSGTPYLIDRNGTVLEQMKEESILFLPIIREIDPSAQSRTYEEAVKFMRFLQDKGVSSYGSALEISGERPEDITLKIDNIPVKIGMGDFEKKLERLQFVKDEIQRRNMAVEYVDIRFADEVVVKPVKHEEPPAEKGAVKDRDGKKKKKP